MASESQSEKPATTDLVGAALFLSGLTAISYEIVWQRLLVRTTGATLPAVSTIYCIFIAGLWLGALASVALIRRSPTPLRIYAFIEMGIAFFGMAMPAFFSEKCSAFVFAWLNKFIGAGVGISLESQAAALQNALYLVALLLPAILMGLTFNCLAKFVYDSDSDRNAAAARISKYYALNIWGGAAGCFVTAFFLIPNLGLSISSMLMAVLNVLVFVVLFGCSLVVQKSTDPFAQLLALFSPPNAVPTELKSSPTEAKAFATRQNDRAGSEFLANLALSFSVSLSIMVLEVAWTRLMMLELGSSTYSVSSVLLMVFIAFAISARLISNSSYDSKQLVSLMPQLLLLASLAVTLGLWAVPFIPLCLLSFQQLLLAHSFDIFTAFLMPRLTISAILILPPVVALGCLFPILLKVGCLQPVGKSSESETTLQAPVKLVGSLFAASAAGSICGALLTGFILIPFPMKELLGFGTKSGIETSLGLVSSCLLLFAILVRFTFCAPATAEPKAKARVFQLFWFLAAVAGLTIWLRPLWNLQLLTIGPSFFRISDGTNLSQERLLKAIEDSTGKNGALFYKEGMNQTVSVEENPGANVRFLKNDGKTEAALPVDWSRPAVTSDAPTHLMLGTVPFYFCENKSPLKTLVIGFGAGTTSGAASCMPGVGNLQVAELEPAVYQAAKLFEPSNLGPLTVPGSPSHVDRLVADGRNFLRTHENVYDVIISQPCEPWISGASDLYTKEFWQLAAKRLQPGGVMCQWLQLYSIDQSTLKSLLATFHDSFSEAYIVHSTGAGEVLLIGRRTSEHPDARELIHPSLSALNRYLENALIPIVAKLCQGGKTITVPPLRCDFLLAPDQVAKLCAGAPVNTDDRLETEYRLATQLLGPNDNVTSNLQWLQGK